MSQSVSPPAARLRAPRWLDGRLIVGVLLVLVAVVLGARIVAAADTATRVWALRVDVAPGTTLTADDVRVTRVRFHGEGGHYLDAAGPSPVGSVLTRAIGSGELLPRSALARTHSGAASRLVTIPVSRLHTPTGLRHGQLVDVFATYGEKSSATRTVAILRAMPVDSVTKSAGGLSASSADLGVGVRVPPEQVGVLVAAIQVARIDLVRVVPGADAGDVGVAPVVIGAEAP